MRQYQSTVCVTEIRAENKALHFCTKLKSNQHNETNGKVESHIIKDFMFRIRFFHWKQTQKCQRREGTEKVIQSNLVPIKRLNHSVNVTWLFFKKKVFFQTENT